MSNIDMAKKLTAWAVGLSAGWITTNALRNNVNPESKLQKAEAVVGGIVVGSMVSDAAESYTNRKIDEIVAIFKSDEKPNFIVT